MFGIFSGLPALGVLDIIDILIVAFVLYWIMLLVKGTRAEKMLWGLLVVIVVYFASKRFELLTLHWILNNFLGSLVIVIIVVFQQDIRRALVQMGRAITARKSVFTGFLDEMVKAVAKMSEKRMGGLMVIERGVDLRDILQTGVEMDGEVMEELLIAIFCPSSPLHDGAVVIRNGRIIKVGCILPLTEKELPKSMGTRHRAAIGLSEESDAVIVAVSEETGEISLAMEDVFIQGIAPEELHAKLKEIIVAQRSPDKVLSFGKGF